MRSRSNNLETIARLALKVAEESFPSYYHRNSPKTFRLPQLIACVILKIYLRQDYRGCEEILRVSPPLRDALQLKRTPDYSTLARAFNKASPASLESMLGVVLQGAGITQSEAAVDATGFQTGNASEYFNLRRGRRNHRWVKLSTVVLLPSLLVASAKAGWGPSNDRTSFVKTVQPAAERANITDLYGDAGYDAEWIHAWCRDQQGIRSWIPAVKKIPLARMSGAWRKHVATNFPATYGRRWGVETVYSVIKRRLGCVTTSRTPFGKKREVLLKAVVYNIER